MIVMLFSKMTRCIKRAQCLNICIQENEHKKIESISHHEYRFKEIGKIDQKTHYFVFFEKNITPKCVDIRMYGWNMKRKSHIISDRWSIEWLFLNVVNVIRSMHTTFAIGLAPRSIGVALFLSIFIRLLKIGLWSWWSKCTYTQ